jgi:hypothetical protein
VLFSERQRLTDVLFGEFERNLVDGIAEQLQQLQTQRIVEFDPVVNRQGREQLATGSAMLSSGRLSSFLHPPAAATPSRVARGQARYGQNNGI